MRKVLGVTTPLVGVFRLDEPVREGLADDDGSFRDFIVAQPETAAQAGLVMLSRRLLTSEACQKQAWPRSARFISASGLWAESRTQVLPSATSSTGAGSWCFSVPSANVRMSRVLPPPHRAWAILSRHLIK